jgi:hypothetical protein
MKFERALVCTGLVCALLSGCFTNDKPLLTPSSSWSFSLKDGYWRDCVSLHQTALVRGLEVPAPSCNTIRMQSRGDGTIALWKAGIADPETVVTHALGNGNYAGQINQGIPGFDGFQFFVLRRQANGTISITSPGCIIVAPQTRDALAAKGIDFAARDNNCQPQISGKVSEESILTTFKVFLAQGDTSWSDPDEDELVEALDPVAGRAAFQLEAAQPANKSSGN